MVSTMPAKHLAIAVIGDKDLVSGLRLAGVSRYYTIEDGHDAQGDVRKALSELIHDPNVGIIVIQEDQAKYVEDLLTQVRKGKRTTPVIVEVPSKFGTKYKDVTAFYKAFIKQSIGFDVEI